jgi:hypothetical protein
MEKPRRVLPADVYDALEFAAEEFGGIGGGSYFTAFAWAGSPQDCPWCVHGLADEVEFTEPLPYAAGMRYGGEVSTALRGGVHLLASTSYPATAPCGSRSAARARSSGKVTFAEWAAELGVERGE